MRRRASPGFTLIELIIVMVISGMFMVIAGILLVTSFESWMKAEDKASVENDAQYFRRKLEFQFGSATAEPVSITQTAVPDDTLRFAAYGNGSNLLNQYTQNEYKLVGNNLLRTYWNARYSGGVLVPQNPWGSGGTAETIMPNVVSLRFQRANMEPTGATSAVSVTVVQQKNLPGGGVYASSSTFVVRTRNRGR